MVFMKNVHLLSTTLIFVLFSLSLSFHASAYPSGAPAGYTGSPGDGQHCVACHGGSAVTVTGWITTNIPATGYIAGTVYTITATVSGSGKKGLEVSPQSATGTQLGILAAGSNNHLVGGTKYITQNSAGSTSSTVTYNFSWTAPAAGTGPVTFYGAFCVGKSNTKLSTTVVSEDASLPLSASATSTPSAICAGQSVQLNAVPAGGSGSYTYSWSSNPPGFTSTLQNPVVTPAISTQYIVNVSDGAQSVDASTNVSVTQPATAVAGNDTTFAYATTQVPLNGAATNYSGVLWSTSGTGTFSAANALSGNYLPSTSDKTAGSVTLTLTSSPVSPCYNPVSDQCVIHFDSPIGLPESLQEAIRMTISPNPAAGIFSVTVKDPEIYPVNVVVSDVCGKKISSQILHEGELKAYFDLSGHTSGVYFVSVQADGKSLVKKLIIN